MAYLAWLAAFFFLPIALLWLTHARLLWRYKAPIVACTLWVLAFGLAWDYLLIHGGVFIFLPGRILGLWLAGVPLEDYIYFVLLSLLLSTVTIVLRERAGKWLIDKSRL